MATITQIIVTVEFQNKLERIAHEEVVIPVAPNQHIEVGDLVDACQRSVAHCIDELQKHLDSKR